MFLMDALPKTLSFVFIITAMLGIGMQTTTGGLRSLLASKGLFFRTLLANFAVVPLVGVALVKALPLKSEEATALLLLACAPGGISALQFTTKIEGASLFAGGAAFFLSFLAVFISPVLLAILHPEDVPVALPHGRALLFVVVCLLLPLAAGILLRDRAGRRAERLSKLCLLISTIAFVVVVALIMDRRKEAMNALGKEALLHMLLFMVASMAVGWLLGGPAKETRPILAVITGMRNVSLCLLIALEAFPGPAVQAPLVAFSALMVPPNMLLTACMVVHLRLSERRRR